MEQLRFNGGYKKIIANVLGQETEYYVEVRGNTTRAFNVYFHHMDTNEKIRAKLVGLSRSGGLEPITVAQNFGEGNVETTVRLFDFDNLENNDFLVTNQFQLDGLKLPIFPDIVIFVNGIPLIIIECKSPYIRDPIQEAVEKNFERYQSRGAGYERLMFFTS